MRSVSSAGIGALIEVQPSCCRTPSGARPAISIVGRGCATPARTGWRRSGGNVAIPWHGRHGPQAPATASAGGCGRHRHLAGSAADRHHAGRGSRRRGLPLRGVRRTPWPRTWRPCPGCPGVTLFAEALRRFLPGHRLEADVDAFRAALARGNRTRERAATGPSPGCGAATGRPCPDEAEGGPAVGAPGRPQRICFLGISIVPRHFLAPQWHG
jgi:hypothetical protein